MPMADKKKMPKSKTNGAVDMVIYKDNLSVAPEVQKACADQNKRRKSQSKKKTPKAFIKKRPDGFDYVDEAYMREQLNLAYPGLWSWLPGTWDVKGDWVVSSGTLQIIEPETKTVRQWFSPGAARIQFKKGQPHSLDNVIDLDKNIASANAFCFKRAVNRLINVADDVYRKVSEDNLLSEDAQKELIQTIQQSVLEKNVQDALIRKIDLGQINQDNVEDVHKYIKEKEKTNE
tara:strand:- start:34789 stop:35484 length:696 start_codon:yes stop_codon:yes gene_type:complete